MTEKAESTQEQLFAIEPKRKKLTAEDIGDLLFFSFLFSQGNIDLHWNLIHYFKFYYGGTQQIDLQQITSHFNQKAVQTITENDSDGCPRTVNRLKSQQDDRHLRIEADPAAVGLEWARNFTFHLECPNHGTRSSASVQVNIKQACEHIILTDCRYMLKGRPRPELRSSSRQLVNPQEDPYFSFLVHYGIQKNPTKNEALDALMQRVTQAIYVCSAFDDMTSVYAKYIIQKSNSLPYHNQVTIPDALVPVPDITSAQVEALESKFKPPSE